jgi:hypothetical protein
MGPQDVPRHKAISLLPVMHDDNWLGATVHIIKLRLLKFFADVQDIFNTSISTQCGVWRMELSRFAA